MQKLKLFFKVTAEVVAALKSVSVTDEELQAAKKTLLMESSESMLNGAAVTEFLASSSMHGVESSFADLINMVSTADLNVSYFFIFSLPFNQIFFYFF